MKNYRAGFRVGSSVGRHLKKGVELLKEHAAKKEAKKVQAGKDKIQKSEMGYAKGGRAGFATGGRGDTARRSPSRRRGRGRDTEQDRKKDLAKLATTHEEGKKDHKPKSYLDKDTEKQVKTSQTGNVKKYKPFPKHMNWHTGRVRSDEHKKYMSGLADIHAAHGGEGFKKGGRTGLKKGGPKPGTYDYFLLHKKREKKAFGGPSHSVRRAVKKILKKAKAKKDTESVKDVR